MTLSIPDDILKQAGVSERDAAIELACGLFRSERLTLGQAVRLAGMSRTEFEAELRKRNIPAYRITPEVLREDMETLRKLGA